MNIDPYQPDENFDEKWRMNASCKVMDSYNFFPERINKFNKEKILLIKKMCEKCPVQVDCFYEAIRGDYDGIWGGIEEKQRRAWMKYIGTLLITYDQCFNFLKENTNHKTIRSNEE